MTKFQVSHPIQWTIVGHEVILPSVARWTSEDPLAVEIVFEQPAGEVSWMFSRDLFADVVSGRCTEAGDGDVHVAKSSSSDNLILTLSVGQVAHLKVDTAQINSFLQSTFIYSPYGEEEMDIDATIGKLLGGGWASGV